MPPRGVDGLSPANSIDTGEQETGETPRETLYLLHERREVQRFLLCISANGAFACDGEGGIDAAFFEQ